MNVAAQPPAKPVKAGLQRVGQLIYRPDDVLAISYQEDGNIVGGPSKSGKLVVVVSCAGSQPEMLTIDGAQGASTWTLLAKIHNDVTP